MCETMKITYTYQFDEGDVERHDVVLETDTAQLQSASQEDLPEWTRLEQHQCANCPLKAADHPHCPAAVAINNIATQFAHRTSYTEVNVKVETESRTVSKRTPLQEGLFPLIGLKMATSGCPVLGKLKPMARFHLPFADTDETAYRAISMYLVSQSLRQSRGEPADYDLSHLSEIYEQVHKVNMAFAQRLSAASSADANVNSLTTLDMFAQDVPFSIDTSMEHLHGIFQSYLDSE